MACLDWSQCPAVESVPGKVSGAWVLRGTRMPVSAILDNFEAGASVDDIMKWFDGLDRKQVEAVIEFAVRSLEKAEAIRLSPEAQDRFVSLLLDPPPLSDALRRALERHRSMIVE